MKPDIIKAVQDPNLFRGYVAGDSEGSLESYANWLAFLKVLYGLRTSKAEAEVIKRCTGREPKSLSRDGYQEALVLCGRRSGKSKMIALVGAAEAILSGREKSLAPGEIGMVAILSPTRNQSRVIHEYTRGVFDSSPILRNELVEEKRDAFVLRNAIEVAIITGDPRSCRGFSLVACIVDEIAMFGLSEESKVRNDLELIRSLRPALATTGGRLLSVGTAYASKGYAYTTFKRGYGNECDILVWSGPSLLMNPTLNPAIVQRAIDEDPIAARVEYAVQSGLFREDVDEFVSRAVVENLVIRGRKELPPRFGVRYGAFADVSGGRHDDAAIAIAHMEGRVVVLDLLERFKAPHNPYEVVAEMAAILKRYGLNRCVGDAYSAEWSRTAFEDHGIRYNRATRSEWKEGRASWHTVAKPKSILYAELLPRLNSGELELLDDDLLVTQLCSLERRTRSGAKDSIDHPPGGHDDLANCLAGVCDAAVQPVPMTLGVFGTGNDEGEPAWIRDAKRLQQAYLADQRDLARSHEVDESMMMPTTPGIFAPKPSGPRNAPRPSGFDFPVFPQQ